MGIEFFSNSNMMLIGLTIADLASAIVSSTAVNVQRHQRLFRPPVQGKFQEKPRKIERRINRAKFRNI
jgi:hypothetical protein